MSREGTQPSKPDRGSAISKADWQLIFENFEVELSGADDGCVTTYVQAQQEVACVCSAMTFETNAR